MDALSIASSGMHSAGLRLGASAHNVANLGTSAFHPLRAIQTSLEGGGSEVHVRQSPNAEEVDLVREIADQMRASLQFKASLRSFGAAADVRGYLLDLLA